MSSFIHTRVSGLKLINPRIDDHFFLLFFSHLHTLVLHVHTLLCNLTVALARLSRRACGSGAGQTDAC